MAPAPRLTRHQVRALRAAQRDGGVRTPQATCNRLELRGLMRWDEQVAAWRITDAGRHALARVAPDFETATPAAGGLRYTMTIKASGRPERHFAGSSQAELDRDLAECVKELGHA